MKCKKFDIISYATYMFDNIISNIMYSTNPGIILYHISVISFAFIGIST